MYFHKKMLAVVVRWEREGQTRYDKRQFGTTQDEIGHLVAWRQHLQVAEVVMESTAPYWRPVWYGREPHFRLHLVHPLKVRAARAEAGLWDAQRIADRWSSGIWNRALSREPS